MSKSQRVKGKHSQSTKSFNVTRHPVPSGDWPGVHLVRCGSVDAQGLWFPLTNFFSGKNLAAKHPMPKTGCVSSWKKLKRDKNLKNLNNMFFCHLKDAWEKHYSSSMAHGPMAHEAVLGTSTFASRSLVWIQGFTRWVRPVVADPGASR